MTSHFLHHDILEHLQYYLTHRSLKHIEHHAPLGYRVYVDTDTLYYYDEYYIFCQEI